MNLYAHAIQAIRKTDRATMTTVVSNYSVTMADSIALAYKGALDRWPTSDFTGHSVMSDASLMFPHDFIQGFVKTLSEQK